MDSKVNTRMDRLFRTIMRVCIVELMDIASRLDQAMKAAGAESQSSLSRASGVPQPTINRILKGGGKRGPESETLKKLAEACNVRFEWLNEGRGPMERTSREPNQSDDVMTLACETPEELKLLAMYRLASDKERNIFNALANDISVRLSARARNQG